MCASHLNKHLLQLSPQSLPQSLSLQDLERIKLTLSKSPKERDELLLLLNALAHLALPEPASSHPTQTPSLQTWKVPRLVSKTASSFLRAVTPSPIPPPPESMST